MKHLWTRGAIVLAVAACVIAATAGIARAEGGDIALSSCNGATVAVSITGLSGSPDNIYLLFTDASGVMAPAVLLGAGQTAYSITYTIPGGLAALPGTFQLLDDGVGMIGQPALLGPTDCGAAPTAGSPGVVSSRSDCTKTTWLGSGVAKNQGDCVSYLTTKTKNQLALGQ